jgi:hypothetical protein
LKTSVIIGEILAAWEDAANVAAIDCHSNAEEDAYNLLRNGVSVPGDATDAERIKAERAAWVVIENGRELAKTWRHISNGLRRYLRIFGVPTYSKRRTDADNARRAAEAKKRKRSYYT